MLSVQDYEISYIISLVSDIKKTGLPLRTHTKKAFSRKRCFWLPDTPPPGWHTTGHSYPEDVSAQLHGQMCSCITPVAILMVEGVIRMCTPRKIPPWRRYLLDLDFLGIWSSLRLLARCSFGWAQGKWTQTTHGQGQIACLIMATGSYRRSERGENEEAVQA